METKPTYREVNEDIAEKITKTGPLYYVVFVIVLLSTAGFYFLPWVYQIYTGQGVTGLNSPNYWGIYIVNFIFWIGIAHAGTLISAMLYITETSWRRTIHRSAETMTAFSLVIAVSFIMVHMGRVWNFYWVFPYPNQRAIWVNFQSPLIFDVFAINTYLLCSFVFLYFGMIPDLASMGGTVTGWRGKLYKTLSLGWRGTASEWKIRDNAYMFFSALIMPLVVSVHSVVSWDFAFSIVPGLGKTIFAPYFVTGALYSGFAGVVLLISILRKIFNMGKYITKKHYDSIGKMILILSLIWTYLTILENITGLIFDSSFETEHLKYRFLTPGFSHVFIIMMVFNAIIPLALIFRRVRVNVTAQIIISLLIVIGMWLERYIIITTSLPRKFLPFAWHDYYPGWVELSITIGSFFLLASFFMIFMKIFPIMSVVEAKEDIGLPIKGVRWP